MSNVIAPKFKLAVIGEVMAEISGKPFSKMQQSMGGDTLNTSIYLKKIFPKNNKVSFISVMGHDVLTKAVVSNIETHNVDTEQLLYCNDKQIGLYYVHNDSSGERFFQYWRSDSAARYLICLLYTSPSPRDRQKSRMPSSA